MTASGIGENRITSSLPDRPITLRGNLQVRFLLASPTMDKYENPVPNDDSTETDEPRREHLRSPQHGEEQGREVPGFNHQGYRETPDATDPSKD